MPDQPSSTLPPAWQHLYWIDWLRFLAAFLVLTEHARASNWNSLQAYAGTEDSPALAIFLSLTSLGKQAVIVFFVLSGWLVGGLTVIRVRAGSFEAAAYAADRFSRVYLPLVPALGLTFVSALMRGDGLDPMQYVVSLLGLQGASGVIAPIANSPLWTLGYEIWFYVLAGCTTVACRHGSTDRQRLAGGIGAGLAVGGCVTSGWLYLSCWLVGVAGPWLRGRLGPAARPWTALAGLAVVAAGSLTYQIGVRILPPVAGFARPSADAGQLTVALGALLLAASLSAMSPRTPAGRRIEQAGGWLAAFSYTLYLTHAPILAALSVRLGRVPPVVTLPAALRALGWASLCIVMAQGMYLLFEQHTPRVRRWLRTLFSRGADSRLLPAATARPTLAAGTT